MLYLKLVHFFVPCVLLALSAVFLPAQHLRSSRDTLTRADLYARHCAVCHGDDLRGTGPIPPPYRKPPDLTNLARRHDGKFPETYVAKVLRNGVTLPTHGPAEMPVWGSEFAAKDGIGKAEVEERIRKLVLYIKSAQK